MKRLTRVLLYVTLIQMNYGQAYPSYIKDILAKMSIATDLRSLQQPPTFTDLAFLYGHPAETHHTTTEDGYILTLFRLPGNRTTLPVLLFHGILDSSDTWIIRGNTSLSVTLANEGYDVWLGNVRGNRYSRGHVNLDPNVDPTYWNFTFNEHGLYDLASTVDYILNNTGATKLNMFGHSQGSTMIWVLLSTRTEYNHKINVATALAPVCYLKHIVPILSVAARLFSPLYPLVRDLGITNVLEYDSIGTLLLRLISVIPVLGYLIVAYGIIFPIFGLDSSELEENFLPTVTQHAPTGTSTKNLAHFSQAVISGQFAHFDYGKSGNLVRYNSSKPSLYKLENIRTKVVLLAAWNDILSQIVDVNLLRRKLPDVVQYVINPRLKMNHLDFTWGRTAPKYLHRYILNVLKKYG